jgi:hypothetical protein
MCIPSSVLCVCPRCFAECTRLSYVAFETGSPVTAIPLFAFFSCLSLRSICIPSGVHTLGQNSFCACRELAHVGFESHSQIRLIEANAFWHCSQLQSVSLPAGLESLGRGTLPWASLEYIGIDAENRHFSLSSDHLLVFDGVAIVGHCGRPTELCIGNTIEDLSDGCFAAQKSISAVSFEPGSRLRRIGDSAFHMAGLVSIVILASVARLENLSLADCPQLAIITIEANSRLLFVAKTAFRSCSSLKEVRIPAHLKSILAAAFQDACDVQIVIV